MIKFSLSYNLTPRKYKHWMLLALLAFTAGSCKHEPLVPGNGNNNNGNNNPGEGIPCDPNVVYFEQQLLPILIAKCTRDGGCHAGDYGEDGVYLNNYFNVVHTADIDLDDPFDSDFWEALNETDPQKHMPPPNEPQLSPDDWNLIVNWLNQGAQNLFCDEDLSGCDTTNVGYAATIVPIMQSHCVSCHQSANSGNKFVQLTDYTGVAAVAATGQLVGAITHNPNYSPMPWTGPNPNGPMLSNCKIDKISTWVNANYPDN